MNQQTSAMPDDPEISTIFEGDCPLFELKGRKNGFTTWSARAFAEYLGYRDYRAFKQALNRAQQVLMALEVDLSEHFKQEITPDEKGGSLTDVRLSRFACYLVAMNGDPKKKQVARAQVYFARYSEECQRFMDDAEQLERVLVRDELSEHEKTLSMTVKRAGVESYAYFQNAGYRGLYSMNLSELKKLKSIPEKRSALDFMGKDELAANLFRITQTDAKIKNDRVRGQSALETTAEDVGKKVRKTMHEISGQRPENLPPQEDIKKVRDGLKAAGRVIKSTHPSVLEAIPSPDEYIEAPPESE